MVDAIRLHARAAGTMRRAAPIPLQRNWTGLAATSRTLGSRRLTKGRREPQEKAWDSGAPSGPSAPRRTVALAGAMLVGIVLFGVVMAARTHPSASNLATGTGQTVEPPPRPSSGTTEPPCNGQVHWVGAWMAAPQDTSAHVPAALSTATPCRRRTRSSFTDQSFRMIVTPHVGGSQLRVRLTNRFGGDAVTFTSVHVARRDTGAAVVAGTDRVVVFSGGLATTVPPGAVVVSDPVDLAIDAFHDVAVSFYVRAWRHWTCTSKRTRRST